MTSSKTTTRDVPILIPQYLRLRWNRELLALNFSVRIPLKSSKIVPFNLEFGMEVIYCCIAPKSVSTTLDTLASFCQLCFCNKQNCVIDDYANFCQ